MQTTVEKLLYQQEKEAGTPFEINLEM